MRILLPLCQLSWMSCFLPNGIFFWSRHTPEATLKWICHYPSPSILMWPALQHRVDWKSWALVWAGNLGLPRFTTMMGLFCLLQRKSVHVSPSSMTGRARCCSEGILSLPALCLIIQKQHFKSNIICFVLLPFPVFYSLLLFCCYAL